VGCGRSHPDRRPAVVRHSEQVLGYADGSQERTGDQRQRLDAGAAHAAEHLGAHVAGQDAILELEAVHEQRRLEWPESVHPERVPRARGDMADVHPTRAHIAKRAAVGLDLAKPPTAMSLDAYCPVRELLDCLGPLTHARIAALPVGQRQHDRLYLPGAGRLVGRRVTPAEQAARHGHQNE
jgi:hypothetical protein